MIDEKDNFLEIAKTKGERNETYLKARKYIQDKCRGEGIDAALKYTNSDGEVADFDALLLCDRKGAGQQLAAQAGWCLLPP